MEMKKMIDQEMLELEELREKMEENTEYSIEECSSDEVEQKEDEELEDDEVELEDDEDDDDEEDDLDEWLKLLDEDERKKNGGRSPNEVSAEALEDSLRFLDDMVGMEHVKAKLQRLGRYVLWKKKLEEAGMDTQNFPQPNLTFMFLGDPGTGKTTVARHMGEVLHSIGLLSTSEVTEFRREDLTGECYGAEERNTKEALEKTENGVLFLDEAYQCFKQSTDKRDPGYHILETLMAQFDKPGRCIIMAGYKNEMLELFKVNPGFRSRIPDENIIEFKGATEQMLMDVATNAFGKMELQLTTESQSLLQQHIHDMWVGKDRDFGNARVIRQLADAVVINHANRIMAGMMSEDFTINASDLCQSLGKPRVKTPTRTRIGFV